MSSGAVRRKALRKRAVPAPTSSTRPRLSFSSAAARESVTFCPRTERSGVQVLSGVPLGRGAADVSVSGNGQALLPQGHVIGLDGLLGGRAPAKLSRLLDALGPEMVPKRRIA